MGTNVLRVLRLEPGLLVEHSEYLAVVEDVVVDYFLVRSFSLVVDVGVYG